MIRSKNARGNCPFKDARSNLPISRVSSQDLLTHAVTLTDPWKTGVTIRRVQLVSGNPLFSHNLKRFRGDLRREPAPAARVAVYCLIVSALCHGRSVMQMQCAETGGKNYLRLLMEYENACFFSGLYVMLYIFAVREAKKGLSSLYSIVYVR